MPKTEQPEQLMLFSVWRKVPRGDGSFVLIPETPSEWLTTEQAARALGCIDACTVRRWAREGRVVARRVGLRKFQISRDDLERQFGQAFNHLKGDHDTDDD